MLTAGAIRVLVVDDHPVVREGVALLVRHDPGVRIVGQAGDAAGAVAEAVRLRPTLVLLDLRLPDQLAPEATSVLKAAVPGVRVLVFTAHADRAALDAALAAGADGCVLKDTTRTGLVLAITRVAAGERWVDPRIAGERAPAAPLSPREYAVLRRVALGETNPEIAAALALSRNTVKSYLANAMTKLGARNRVDAIMRAGELGLL